MNEPLRMDAYYYSFDPTGVVLVDRILSAVATAGKHYHHTESWSDHDDGPSEAEVIQREATDAAERIQAVIALHAPSQEGRLSNQHPPGYRPFCLGCWDAGGMDGAPAHDDCPTLKALGVKP